MEPARPKRVSSLIRTSAPGFLLRSAAASGRRSFAEQMQLCRTPAVAMREGNQERRRSMADAIYDVVGSGRVWVFEHGGEESPAYPSPQAAFEAAVGAASA